MLRLLLKKDCHKKLGKLDFLSIFARKPKKVSWPRGLGNGLQNRAQQFDSARDLIKIVNFGNLFLSLFFSL